MTAETIADLRRELEKARLALIASQSHLAAHAEANAALHCSTTVLYSPLHAQVTAAIGQIENALERTQQAFIDASRTDEPDRNLEKLGEILLDLDRCNHGRHSIDPCAGCGGATSIGNAQLKPGQLIGFTVYGDRITMPTGDRMSDPDAWRAPRRDRKAAAGHE